MDAVNVLAFGELDDRCKQLIKEAGPWVNLVIVPEELRQADRSGDPAARARMDSLLTDAEVIYGWLPHNVLARSPRLKWLQVTSAGVERLMNRAMLESPVVVTNVSGIHAIPIGEFVLAMMLMLVKQMPLCFKAKQERQWRRTIAPSILRSKTVGIVGLGNIGREVAHLAKAFGMTVLATRRSAREGARARYVDVLLPASQLGRLLAESDFVVLAVPLTAETQRLIGEKELRAMKPTAYLVNIARGGAIDEDALVRALEEHWIAGAGLDVFDTEPLPATSRLWELPNVIISPHIAGNHEDYMLWATDVFADNLKRYLSGRRLRNVVDKRRGY